MAGTSRTDSQILNATTARGDPPTNYDVFINHRGPDVKKGFVDHLVTALKHVGVYSFVDYNNLDQGEDTWPNIVSAIHRSKFHIAIFSPNYASSVWCLKELCEILECRTKESFLPIFFNVPPSDLRFLPPKSNYCEAFAKHDTRNDEEDVRKWKKALYNASMVTGWTLEDVGGFEARLVKLILSKIVDVLNPRSLNVAKHPVGMDEKLREVLDRIKIANVEKAPGGLLKLGLHGMGGIGKTTLARSIFNEMYKGFDGSCFVESVRSQAQAPNGLRMMQNQILCDLLREPGISVSTLSNGKQVMSDRCSGLKVLLILDDIDDREQLDALLTPFESSRVEDGSLAVITTRDEQIVKWANVQGQLPLEGLSEADGHLLFNWHAFLRPEEPLQGFEALAKEVVDACQGLPLALETLGAHLCGKGMGIWEATVKALRSDRGNFSRAQREVMRVLKISFDGLSEEEREMFLDVACFFIIRGYTKLHLERVWSGSDTAELSFETLRLKSLVKVDENGCLTMHDLLRDMGREIVVYGHDLSRDRGQKDVWERRYLWNPTDIQSVLRRRKGASELRALCMERWHPEGGRDENVRHCSLLQVLLQFFRISERRPSRNAESFAGMDSLKYLVLGSGVKMTGDFQCLFPKELRWLKWTNCPLRKLPRKLDLSKLAVLDLRRSSIESLANGHKFENLRELRLFSCLSFGPGLPDFRESCKSLEVLDLAFCCKLESVPESIGCLNLTLTHLNLSGCQKLTVLPDSIVSLTNLVQLDAMSCISLVRLPEEIGSLRKLVRLNLSHCDNLMEVPPLPSSLEELHTEGCSNLREIRLLPGSFLKMWSTRDCPRLMRLPYNLYLEFLDAFGCRSLGTPEGCSQLAALTSLRHLHLLETGVSLGQWIENLASLETVALDGESLPEFVSRYKAELKVKRLGMHRYSVEMTMPRTFDGTECKALVIYCTSLHRPIFRAVAEFRSNLSSSTWVGYGRALQIGIFRATEYPFVASLKAGTTRSFQVRQPEYETMPVVAVGVVYEDHELKEVVKQLAGTGEVKHGQE